MTFSFLILILILLFGSPALRLSVSVLLRRGLSIGPAMAPPAQTPAGAVPPPSPRPASLFGRDDFHVVPISLGLAVSNFTSTPHLIYRASQISHSPTPVRSIKVVLQEYRYKMQDIGARSLEIRKFGGVCS